MSEVLIRWEDGEEVRSTLASFLDENVLDDEDRAALLEGKKVLLGGGACPLAIVQVVS